MFACVRFVDQMFFASQYFWSYSCESVVYAVSTSYSSLNCVMNAHRRVSNIAIYLDLLSLHLVRSRFLIELEHPLSNFSFINIYVYLTQRLVSMLVVCVLEMFNRLSLNQICFAGDWINVRKSKFVSNWIDLSIGLWVDEWYLSTSQATRFECEYWCCLLASVAITNWLTEPIHFAIYSSDSLTQPLCFINYTRLLLD